MRAGSAGAHGAAIARRMGDRRPRQAGPCQALTGSATHTSAVRRVGSIGCYSFDRPGGRLRGAPKWLAPSLCPRHRASHAYRRPHLDRRHSRPHPATTTTTTTTTAFTVVACRHPDWVAHADRLPIHTALDLFLSALRPCIKRAAAVLHAVLPRWCHGYTDACPRRGGCAHPELRCAVHFGGMLSGTREPWLVRTGSQRHHLAPSGACMRAAHDIYTVGGATASAAQLAHTRAEARAPRTPARPHRFRPPRAPTPPALPRGTAPLVGPSPCTADNSCRWARRRSRDPACGTCRRLAQTRRTGPLGARWAKPHGGLDHRSCYPQAPLGGPSSLPTHEHRLHCRRGIHSHATSLCVAHTPDPSPH